MDRLGKVVLHWLNACLIGQADKLGDGVSRSCYNLTPQTVSDVVVLWCAAFPSLFSGIEGLGHFPIHRSHSIVRYGVGFDRKA